ncbi:uncharacterized protein LOC114252782 [Bombyx mandarina]|uniref:Uncharacterized protein LOC114252782 n=1 Tax=Bombyx mandarina TaxID=7092 RepID=A0A6J2KLL2_BOMMA|nr:uncharacterized protein LOC114252782 [Bombyx mandarina]
MDLKYKHLVDKLNIQEKQIDYLDRENKRRNLVFFGIEEEERSYFQLYTKVAYIITMNMKLSCEKYDIENVKRIGKKRNKVRPIIVALTTLEKKMASTSYYIQEDYPKKVLEIRKPLKVTVEELRQEGKAAIIKYDKLIILKDKLPKQHQQSKKRMLTPSPATQNNAKIKNKNGLAEVRRMGCYIKEHEDYIFCYIGETPGLYRVGFLVKKEHKNKILSFSSLSERVAMLQIKCNNATLSIIQAYAPAKRAPEEDINLFYETLETALS